MELINYLYIDDLLDEAKIIAKSRSNEFLEIDAIAPFEEDKKIRETIFKKYDGLILDQRLDDSQIYGLEKRGTAICQFLRTISNENNTDFVSIPIILFTASKYKDDFIREETAHDLFDKVYFKGDYNQNMSKVLVSLAQGYKFIKTNKSLEAILNITANEIDEIDFRLIEKLKSELIENKAIHNFTLFFIKQVLDKNGALIDELVLAARLGIDITKNTTDWKLLVEEHLIEFQYKGVFSQAWKRWWMFKIENWWVNEFGTKEHISEIDAENRVKLINEKFKLNLIPAQKTERSSSSQFWTICQGTKQPIDILDGIRIVQDLPQPWQDEQYISIDELISEKNKGEYWKDVHPSDKIRSQEIKEKSIKIRKK